MSEQIDLTDYADSDSEEDSEWVENRLGEIFESIYSGGTPKKGVDEYYDGNIPFVKIEDLNKQQGSGVTTAENYITEQALEETSTRAFDSGTLLMTIYGSLAETALVQGRVATNQGILGLWNAGDDNVHYVRYAIDDSQPKLASLSRQTTQANLGKGIVKKHKIPIPPLSEQRKIATVLYTVDRAIEKTEELVNQTERVKQGITQDILKNGTNNETTVETGSRFGKLPKSWELRRLKEVGDIAGRTAPEKEDSECWGGDIPWATPSEITSLEGPTIGETEEHLTELALDKVSSNLLPPKSVLLTTRATIGACAVNTVEMTTNQGFKNLIPGEDIDTWYAYYRLDYEGDYLASLSKGSTFPEVGKDTVENFVIPVPPLEEQREIGERLRSVHDQVLSYKENISQLKRLKKGLMQDLLSGTVRTNNTDIEIPDEIAQHG